MYCKINIISFTQGLYIERCAVNQNLRLFSISWKTKIHDRVNFGIFLPVRPQRDTSHETELRNKSKFVMLLTQAVGWKGTEIYHKALQKWLKMFLGRTSIAFFEEFSKVRNKKVPSCTGLQKKIQQIRIILYICTLAPFTNICTFAPHH